MLTDSHAHLDDEEFLADLEDVVERARQAGIRYIVNCGIDVRSCRRGIEMAERFKEIYVAVGIHPHNASTVTDDVLQVLAELSENSKVVAIGEIGLDYYRNLSPRSKQVEAFRAQIRLARRLGLPVVIHDRDAHGDTLKILKEERARDVGGVMHCFSGSWEMARECMQMGFYISFAGPVTFGQSRRLREIARQVPRDRLLLETDCPYLSPEPYRGKRNEPARVRLVAQEIARLKQMALEEIEEVTTTNAIRLFGLR